MTDVQPPKTETLTMRDGSQVEMLTNLALAEHNTLKALDQVMKNRSRLWGALDINDAIALQNAYRELEYARFHASGQKLPEGQLRLP